MSEDYTVHLNIIRAPVSFILSCCQSLKLPDNCETTITKADLRDDTQASPPCCCVSKGRARNWSEDNGDLDIWYWAWFPSGYMLCLPLRVLIAERRMWLTDLKGNYWRESLSMPLTDNQLIIVLIIYTSPPCLLSILLAVSLKQSTETFNGLAESRLWWGRVKTTTSTQCRSPPRLSTLPEKRKKLRKTTYATLTRVVTLHPNMANCAWNWTDWSYWPEGPTPERTGRRRSGEGGLCVTWLSEKSSASCFDARPFTEKSDLMKAARPHQCQRSWWRPSAQPCFI